MDCLSLAGAWPSASPRSGPVSRVTVENARQQLLVAAGSVRLRDDLAALLRLVGVELRLTGDGREALRWLLSEPVRLAVLDQDLPFLTGLQVLEELRRQSDMPVILLGPHHLETMRAAVWLGADRYFVRPPDPDLFRRAVDRLLGRLRDE
jgi:DNA-binding response OmpR family regulator